MTQIAPTPKFSATLVDADGFTKPAVGYKLYAYAAGTSTPKDTYTSSTLGTANANPVILDSLDDIAGAGAIVSGHSAPLSAACADHAHRSRR